MENENVYYLNETEYKEIVEFVKDNKESFCNYSIDFKGLTPEIITSLILSGNRDWDSKTKSLTINKIHIGSRTPKIFTDYLQSKLGIVLNNQE